MAKASKERRVDPSKLFLVFLSFLVLSTVPTACSGNRTYIVYMNPARKPSTHPATSSTHTHPPSTPSPHPRSFPATSASSAAPHPFSTSNQIPSSASTPLAPPLFLGLLSTSSPSSPLRSADYAASNVVVGVLDTGVWPESPSFTDSSLPPVPSHWRGQCDSGVDFSPSLCNRKLVGARSFSRGFLSSGRSRREFDSPRDRDGHGTHTSSTVAGSPVSNASLLGYATGTARGMAVAARIAVYKVCWASGCFGSDILAGIDSAISDGVDILSLSLGGGSAPFFRDTIAVGTFAAAERGIFVACSAGNSGPEIGTVSNSAPWITTVGAGTLDRDFPAYAVIGSGKRFTGVSLYSGKGLPGIHSLFYDTRSNASRMCLAGALDPVRVKNKVVFCDRGVNARVEKGAIIRDAGGLGMILANTVASGEELVADSHLLPAVAVGKKSGDQIRKYVISNNSPKAYLTFGGTVVGVRPSPVVAAFSSRGPNPATPEILKPDLLGPVSTYSRAGQARSGLRDCPTMTGGPISTSCRAHPCHVRI
ncbi:hypothetical protein HPP92_003731 [Vanilla planifolia]|uniref:Subtilisin-like protease n=1 Tax=Vanilla planifolia TaxID=51239 RepID=A0A835S3S6_VANPL|nr:hypothetical protein HPP92_003731 [Vanilla planifolia]